MVLILLNVEHVIKKGLRELIIAVNVIGVLNSLTTIADI